MAPTRRARVVPGRAVGFSAGWQAQYFDPSVGVWFDIGDLCESRIAADVKASEWVTAPWRAFGAPPAEPAPSELHDPEALNEVDILASLPDRPEPDDPEWRDA